MNLNGQQKKSYEIDLNFSYGVELEGFRQLDTYHNQLNYQFILDNYWSNSPYMNTENHISSPTITIWTKYYSNIILLFLKEYVDGNIQVINLNKPKNIKLDFFSEKIIYILKDIFKIKFKVNNIEEQKKNIITLEKLKVASKRGFYNEFKEDDSDLYYIYQIYKYMIYGEKINFTEIEKRSRQIKEDSHIYFMFIKILINLAIRNKDSQKSEYYTDILKSISSNLDYLNTKAFQIVRFEGKDECLKFLEDKVDIYTFLNKNNENFSFEESLLYKNFASLLPIENINKKKIMEKCLTQTPQDVDLWKEWFKTFGNENEKEIKYRNMLDFGYVDIELFNNIKLTNLDQDYLIHMILLCHTKKNHQLSNYLLEQILNKDVKILLSKYLKDEKIKNVIGNIPWWEF